MKLIKRELLLCMALTAFVFVCALAWGRPFLSVGSSSVAVHAQTRQTHVSAFEGTVVRSGDAFVLRDASGQDLRLDDAAHVQSYEGKAVTITGRLDPAAKSIHVERVESATV